MSEVAVTYSKIKLIYYKQKMFWINMAVISKAVAEK